MRLREMVIAIAMLLGSCAPANPPRPPLDETASAQTLAGALIHAVREFCVPYVVDGADAGALTSRAGAIAVRYDVNGKIVTRYRLDLPNSPEVTFDEGDYCRVSIEDQPFEDRVAIVDEFVSDLTLFYRPTSEYLPSQREPPPSDFEHTFCVHGENVSIVSISTVPDTVTSPFGTTLHNPPLVDVIVVPPHHLQNCPQPAEGD
jgi:hypothetical protein